MRQYPPLTEAWEAKYQEALELAAAEPLIHDPVAVDFDADGRQDLLVACRGDDTLRLFRNTTVPGGPAYELKTFNWSKHSVQKLTHRDTRSKSHT